MLGIFLAGGGGSGMVSSINAVDIGNATVNWWTVIVDGAQIITAIVMILVFIYNIRIYKQSINSRQDFLVPILRFRRGNSSITKGTNSQMDIKLVNEGRGPFFTKEVLINDNPVEFELLFYDTEENEYESFNINVNQDVTRWAIANLSNSRPDIITIKGIDIFSRLVVYQITNVDINTDEMQGGSNQRDVFDGGTIERTQLP